MNATTATPMLTIVPPLEDGAWVPITAELMWAWRQCVAQDRKREADRPRWRAPALRPDNRRATP